MIPPSTAAGPDPREVAPRRILVVDDHADTAESLGLLLEIAGHDVRVAYRGDDALAVFREFAPAFVLLDLGLPGLDGFEVARRLRALSNDVVLVAISGYGQDADRERSAAAGFDEHFLKPVDLERLGRLLQRPAPDVPRHEQGRDR